MAGQGILDDMTAGTGQGARSPELTDDAAAAFAGAQTVLEITRRLSLRSVQAAQLWSDTKIIFPDSPAAPSSVWRAAVEQLFDPAVLSEAGTSAVDAKMAMAGLVYLHGPLYDAVRDRYTDFAFDLPARPTGGWARTRSITTDGDVLDLLFFRRDQIVTAGSKGGVQVWDMTSMRPIVGVGEEDVTFSTYALAEFDGGIVAAGSGGGVAFRGSRGVEVIRRPAGGTNWNSCIAGRGASDGLLFGSSSGMLIVVDDLRSLKNPRVTAQIDDEAINGLAIIGLAGDRVAMATSSDVRIWVPSLNKVSRVLDAGGAGCSDVTVSPDQGILAAACGDGTVRLWNLGPWGDPTDPRAVLLGHRGPVGAVAFSPSGKLLASGGYDGTVRVWSVDEQTMLEIRPSHSVHVTCVGFGPGASWLASGGWDASICIEPTPAIPVKEPMAARSATLGNLPPADGKTGHDGWAFVESVTSNGIVSLVPLLLVGLAASLPTAAWVRVTCISLLIVAMIALYIVARKRQHSSSIKWPLITALAATVAALVVLVVGTISA